MGISSELRDDGIRVVTMDHPPVNALTVQGWFASERVQTEVLRTVVIPGRYLGCAPLPAPPEGGDAADGAPVNEARYDLAPRHGHPDA